MTLKKIWEFSRVGGKYFGEIEDGQQVQVPYTDVPPLEGTRADGEPLTIDDQIYDPHDRKWIEIINVLDRNELNNLKSLYPVLEEKSDELAQLNGKSMLSIMSLTKENTDLKEKADELAQISSKTMLASIKNSMEIAALKEQQNETDSEETNTNTEGGEADV